MFGSLSENKRKPIFDEYKIACRLFLLHGNVAFLDIDTAQLLHRSKKAHVGKNISLTFSMLTMETCRVLAKTGAERSVDDFVSLRTAMK